MTKRSFDDPDMVGGPEATGRPAAAGRSARGGRPANVFATVACLALAAAVARAAPPADANPTPELLEVEPTLAEGQRFRLEIVKSTRRSERPSPKVKGRSVVDVEVVEAGTEGHVLAWTVRGKQVVGPDGVARPMPPAARGIADAFVGVRMLIQLTPEFKVAGLANYDDVKKAAAGAMKAAEKLIARGGGDTSKYRAAAGELLESRARLEQLCTRELALYVRLTRIRVPKAGTAEYPSELPGLTPGETIPSTMKVTLAVHNSGADKAHVIVRQRVDAKGAALHVRDLLAATAKKLGRPLPPASRRPKLDIRDEFLYVLNTRTGWAESVRFQRDTKYGRRERRDVIEMRRRERE